MSQFPYHNSRHLTISGSTACSVTIALVVGVANAIHATSKLYQQGGFCYPIDTSVGVLASSREEVQGAGGCREEVNGAGGSVLGDVFQSRNRKEQERFWPGRGGNSRSLLL